MINIRKLESELWESADLLRAGSKLTSNQYCMPVLGLIFLRYISAAFDKRYQELIDEGDGFEEDIDEGMSLLKHFVDVAKKYERNELAQDISDRMMQYFDLYYE